MSVTSYKVGVVVIGSLLWDCNYQEKKGYRENWRSQNFENDRIMILAPIRYGRKSGKNKNYTMIYDGDLIGSSKMGIAYILESKNAAMNIDELFEQVELLSLAEGYYEKDEDDSICVVKGKKTQWAVISFMINPKIEVKHRTTFIEHWNSKTNISSFDQDLFFENSNNNFCDSNGEIGGYWPIVVDKNEIETLESFDILLTTCTKMNISKFPNSHELYLDFNNDERRYMKNNIRNGISTFQDVEIMNYAHNTAPPSTR